MSENALYLPLLLIGLHSACATTPAEKKAAAVMQPAPAPAQRVPTLSANAYVRRSDGAARPGGKMDQNDQKKTAKALETSREGSATTWRNPDTGQSYSVTPTRTYQGAAGPCRDFKTVTQIDGREEVVHGTACRQPDRTWKIA